MQVYVELVAFFTFVAYVLSFLVSFDEADLENFGEETVRDGLATTRQSLQFFKSVKLFEQRQYFLQAFLRALVGWQLKDFAHLFG